jgi:hypothetical protein
MLVQASRPMPQRLGVVRREGLNVLGNEAGALERKDYPG